jgi:hypothetical protein
MPYTGYPRTVLMDCNFQMNRISVPPELGDIVCLFTRMVLRIIITIHLRFIVSLGVLERKDGTGNCTCGGHIFNWTCSGITEIEQWNLEKYVCAPIYRGFTLLYKYYIRMQIATLFHLSWISVCTVNKLVREIEVCRHKKEQKPFRITGFLEFFGLQEY